MPCHGRRCVERQHHCFLQQQTRRRAQYGRQWPTTTSGRRLTDLGGDLDEVHPHGLADEGERSGGAQVALDHHAVGALGDELHVERARDVEPLRHGLRCVLISCTGHRYTTPARRLGADNVRVSGATSVKRAKTAAEVTIMV